MQKRLVVTMYIVLILISVVACSISLGKEEQTDQLSQQPEPIQEVHQSEDELTSVPDVSYEGVSFSYDDALASEVVVENVPANPPDEMNTASWEVCPAHIKFHFNGYPLSNRFFDPHIIIYPVNEYRQMSEPAGQTIDDLQQYLVYGSTNEHMLFLPPYNAAQIMNSNVQQMEFQNGEGVRFLTLHGQWIPPVNNHEIVYTFQGITNDGEYYVVAIFPVSHSNLPDDDSLPDGVDHATWSEMASDYVVDQVEMLNAQPSNSFIPDLGLLDALMQSLLIE
ncbi:MAG TPA: hypothetical protein G4N92_08190 [Anaerolineae bacterium]|nr:hypothetical protein [Anaerolineae bacterium]